MAIVETLEVRFQADMSRLSDQLSRLAGQIGTLSTAMNAQGAGLAGCAAGMIRAVGDALIADAASSAAPGQAAADLNSRFALALISGAPASAAAALQNAGAARFDSPGTLSAAVSAGAALGQGFAGGISSKYDTVMAAADRIAAAAVSRIRSALSIHSPSKVSFELGGNFGQGFAEGVSASLRGVENSVGALSTASVAALNPAVSIPAASADAGGISAMVQRAVQNALGDVNLVIPLHVDGIKLGEASIRGINAVTRSAGRLMLEI